MRQHKYDYIDQAVSRLIDRYQSRNPLVLMEAEGIHRIKLEKSQRLLGMYKVILKNRFIFLAPCQDPLQQIVAAHELGHDQLHRHLLNQGRFFIDQGLGPSTNHLEMEANLFAAQLLIPNDNLIQAIHQVDSDQALAQVLNTDKHLVNLKIHYLIQKGLLSLDQTYLRDISANFLHFLSPTR